MKKLLLGILLGAAVSGGIAGYAAVESNAQNKMLIDKINVMGNEISQLKMTQNDLLIENAQLNEQIKWTSIGQFKITYYWPGEDEYGSMTATGVTAKEGRTIAVDPTIIPYGTRVIINNHEYVAEDCGGAVKGKVIDIFVEETYQDMYYTEVFVRNK